MEAIIQAEAEAEMMRIDMELQLQEKESKRKMEQIENEIFREREKSIADANHYKIMKTIQAEQSQLTPEYLQRLAI